MIDSPVIRVVSSCMMGCACNAISRVEEQVDS